MQFSDDNNKNNLKGSQVKSFERKLFRLLHLEVINGSFHLLKRANIARSWTKTASSDCMEKVNGVNSRVLSRKSYRDHSL